MKRKANLVSKGNFVWLMPFPLPFSFEQHYLDLWVRWILTFLNWTSDKNTILINFFNVQKPIGSSYTWVLCPYGNQHDYYQDLFLSVCIQISDLSTITNRAGSTQVLNQGWVIFGGYRNSLTKAQQINNTESQWLLGPYLYKNESVSGQCIVQVNDRNQPNLKEQLGLVG